MLCAINDSHQWLDLPHSQYNGLLGVEPLVRVKTIDAHFHQRYVDGFREAAPIPTKV
ncbi:hypothetical protein [Nostoc sp.]|uniref:hypothetical protein n=1 Tax=Nostoc sp. TaxID=1180 RepID=UPI002FF5AC02